MNPDIKLREHQLGAIAHVLYGGNTLLAHEVGAGYSDEKLIPIACVLLRFLPSESRNHRDFFMLTRTVF